MMTVKVVGKNDDTPTGVVRVRAKLEGEFEVCIPAAAPAAAVLRLGAKIGVPDLDPVPRIGQPGRAAMKATVALPDGTNRRSHGDDSRRDRDYQEA
jgi:hypothetical protein